MKSKAFAEKAFAKLTEAKKQFGEYTYHDKGASDIMELSPLLRELKQMSPTEAGNALILLEEMEDTDILVGGLVSNLDDWDSFFDAPDNAELIARYY